MRGLAAGQAVAIRNPAAVRPWQHVLEPLCGYLLLAERMAGPDAPGGAWNFGPDAPSDATVGTVADTVCRLWGRPDGWRPAAQTDAPHEAALLHLDSAKARAGLGWAPRWDLEAALAAAVDVYRSNRTGADLRRLLMDQIVGYTASPEPAGTSR